MGTFAAGLLFILIASVVFLVYDLFGTAVIASLKALLNPSGQSIITIAVMAILGTGAIYVLGWIVRKVGRRGR